MSTCSKSTPSPPTRHRWILETVKAETIAQVKAIREWADAQLKALDPEIDADESADLSLAAQLAKAEQDLHSV